MDVRLCFVDGVGLSYAFGTSLLCLTAAFMCDTGFAQCVSFCVAFSCAWHVCSLLDCGSLVCGL